MIKDITDIISTTFVRLCGKITIPFLKQCMIKSHHVCKINVIKSRKTYGFCLLFADSES